MRSIFDAGLEPNAANYTPMSPLSFIERAAAVYPERTAIIHGDIRRTWAQTYARCKQLGSALQGLGVCIGDTVAVMLPNTPPMVEAHFGVPMSGAVLNVLNTRLDADAIAFMLDHGEAKVVMHPSRMLAARRGHWTCRYGESGSQLRWRAKIPGCFRMRDASS